MTGKGAASRRMTVLRRQIGYVEQAERLASGLRALRERAGMSQEQLVPRQVTFALPDRQSGRLCAVSPGALHRGPRLDE